MTYAQIVGGRVHGLFVYDPLPEFSADILMVLLPLDSPVQAGWRHLGGDEFAEPEAQEPESLGTRVTVLAFLSRFTDAEAVAIDLASIGATVQAASIRRYMSKVTSATYIDLGRDDTRAGVQGLEAGGLIGAGRAAQILDAPVVAAEVPR